MSRPPRLFFVLSLVLAALAGAIASRPTQGQNPAPALKPENRYQMAVGGNMGNIIVVDTQTGRCWMHNNDYGKEWHDLGTPEK